MWREKGLCRTCGHKPARRKAYCPSCLERQQARPNSKQRKRLAERAEREVEEARLEAVRAKRRAARAARKAAKGAK